MKVCLLQHTTQCGRAVLDFIYNHFNCFHGFCLLGHSSIKVSKFFLRNKTPKITVSRYYIRFNLKCQRPKVSFLYVL